MMRWRIGVRLLRKSVRGIYIGGFRGFLHECERFCGYLEFRVRVRNFTLSERRVVCHFGGCMIED